MLLQLQIFLNHVVCASWLNSLLPRGHKISFDKVASLMSCFSGNALRILHCCKKVQKDKLLPYISMKRNVQTETMTLLFKLVLQTEYVRKNLCTANFRRAFFITNGCHLQILFYMFCIGCKMFYSTAMHIFLSTFYAIIISFFFAFQVSFMM